MAGAMEEATTAVLKTRQGEEREFQVETRLVMEECTALRDKIHPNIPVEVDLDANILEIVVSFLNLRKRIRDQYPNDYTAAQQILRENPKKECIRHFFFHTEKNRSTVILLESSVLSIYKKGLYDL
jgi:hypothetical protein